MVWIVWLVWLLGRLFGLVSFVGLFCLVVWFVGWLFVVSSCVRSLFCFVSCRVFGDLFVSLAACCVFF